MIFATVPAARPSNRWISIVIIEWKAGDTQDSKEALTTAENEVDFVHGKAPLGFSGSSVGIRALL